MNTPPPESEFPKPDPLPSLSMPTIQPSNAESSTTPPIPPIPSNIRRRRHTINRPEAALALLSESDEGETDDQTLDRISGILSNLIQEANEAVQNNGSTTIRRRPNSSTMMKDRRRHSMYSPSQSVDSPVPCRSKSISRLPRPTRQQQYNYTWIHDHPSSGSTSSASSTPLFSPEPTIESPATSSSSVEQQHNVQQHKSQCLEYLEYQRMRTDDEDRICDRRTMSNATPINGYESANTDNSSCDDEEGDTDQDDRQTHDDGDDTYDDDDNDSQQEQQRTSLIPITRRHTLSRPDPLLESLRRLDTSMALVESLSRDLAEEMQQPHQIASDTEETEETEEPITKTSSLSSSSPSSSPVPAIAPPAAEKAVRPMSFISSTSTSKLTLLLLPLLHIPHALITTVFDTLTTPGSTNTTTWNFSSPSPSTSSSTSSFVNHPSSSPSSLSGMIAWTFFFALANMVISWSSVSAPHDLIQQQQHHQQQRLPPSPPPRQSHSDQCPRADLAVRPRRLSLPGSYGSLSNNNDDAHSAMFIMNTSNSNSNSSSNSNSRMVRFRRPAPINTTLCVKKSSSSTYSVRRTTTTTTTTSTIKRTTSKRRLDNDHQQEKQQQLRQLQQLQRQVQQARRLSSTYMDASKHSNDTSFTLAIQRSRIWKQQQHLRHQKLRRSDYLLKKPEYTRKHPVPLRQQQRQQHDPLWTHHRRYSF